MDVQQAVLLETLRRFAELHVEFACPTQTVHHEGLTTDLRIQPPSTAIDWPVM